MTTAAGCKKADPAPPDEPPAAATTPDPLPNVVLITLESLRADHVHALGYDKPTTPHLDALANEGTVFSQAYSVTSWTLPSHASLFTGLYPGAHRVVSPRHRLHDDHDTLAELMARHGYQTAGIVSGPFLRKTFNLHQGFEHYDETPASFANAQAHDDITNSQMETAIDQFLTQQREPDRPFFLFAYFWDPHYDYIPPPPYDAAFVPPGADPIDLTHYETTDTINPDISAAQLDYVVSQYDGEIACTDACLGRLWQRLKALDLWDNTVIMVTADHGEEFFEHGQKGHQHNLHVESLHVPLIVKPAGPAGAATHDDRLVSLVDVLPTLAQWCDLPLEHRLHGRSLLGPPRMAEHPIFFELTSSWAIRTSDPTSGPIDLSENWAALRRGRYKYIIRDLPAARLLYDVANDPRETRPLNLDQADAARDLAALLVEFQDQMRRRADQTRQPDAPTLSPEEKARLSSLGYLP
ncbi:MAG: sulfatase [Phycisphaerae bacterium]